MICDGMLGRLKMNLKCFAGGRKGGADEMRAVCPCAGGDGLRVRMSAGGAKCEIRAVWRQIGGFRVKFS